MVISSTTLFQLKILGSIAIANMLAPLCGLFFLHFFALVESDYVLQIMGGAQFRLSAIAILLSSVGYFFWYMRPVANMASIPDTNQERLIHKRIHHIIWHFWIVFLLASLLRAVNFISASSDYLPTPLTTETSVQILFLALSVSILVGVPIFFILTDIIGSKAAILTVRKPLLTLRSKVLLLGSFVPLLIILLMLLFFSRSQPFTPETLYIVLSLQILAVATSIMVIRSYNQSIKPLNYILDDNANIRKTITSLLPGAFDEIGILTQKYQQILEKQIHAENQLIRSEAELSDILANIEEFFHRTNINGAIVQVSSAVEKALGYQPNELIGHQFTDLVQDPQQYTLLRQQLLQGQKVENIQLIMLHRNGQEVTTTTSLQLLTDNINNPITIKGTSRDITHVIKMQNMLYEEQQKALVTLEAISDGVITIDNHGTIQYANPIAQQLSGRPFGIEGHCIEETIALIDPLLQRPLTMNDIYERVETMDNVVFRASLQQSQQNEIILEISIGIMLNDHGDIHQIVLVLHDVSESEQMSRSLSYQASHDLLTGLTNRHQFEQLLLESLHQSQQNNHKHALLFIDLDQFKVVNDTCGHQAGDELLRQISVTMLQAIRNSDTLARLGGDEFGVILEGCSLENGYTIANEIREKVKEFRFHWEDKTFEIGASIGLVPINTQSSNINELMRLADSACYIAKDLGRNRIYVYKENDEIVAQQHGEMNWVHRITDAMEKNQFVLYAQEIRALQPNASDILHYEILVRMIDSDGSTIPPMAFIPAAERYNMMSRLDRWIIMQTMQQLQAITAAHQHAPISCSINVSGQSLSDDSFLPFLLRTLQQSKIAPQSFCFEITETSAISNLTGAMQLFNAIKDLGATFSLDDFGSGLSSFGYLKNLPVNTLKIDGSFVKDILDDPIDRQMVDSINRIGHIMGLETIAEFVENEEICNLLQEIGIDYGQGYGIAKPVPLAEIIAKYQRQS